MMKKPMKKSYLNKRGMCLIELVVSICLYSIVLISVFKLLTLNLQNYSVFTMKYRESMDLNYALEYIINEIHASDEIYYIEQIEKIKDKYPNNIGFIIKNIENINGDTCKYIFYYQKNNKLYRSAHTIDASQLPYDLNFRRNSNLLADSIVSIESKTNLENLLEISIQSDSREKTKFLDLTYKIQK